MTVRPDSFLGRLVQAARADMPVIRVSAPPGIAKFLVAAGARPAPVGDSMTVTELRTALRGHGQPPVQ
jgi:hypothetical protein